MVKFSGYHEDRVYMPNKPIKFGFKIYMLAESKTGYLLSYMLAKNSSIDKEEC